MRNDLAAARASLIVPSTQRVSSRLAHKRSLGNAAMQRILDHAKSNTPNLFIENETPVVPIASAAEKESEVLKNINDRIILQFNKINSAKTLGRHEKSKSWETQ